MKLNYKPFVFVVVSLCLFLISLYFFMMSSDASPKTSIVVYAIHTFFAISLLFAISNFVVEKVNALRRKKEQNK